MDLRKICEQVIELSKQTGHYIKQQIPKIIEFIEVLPKQYITVFI